MIRRRDQIYRVRERNSLREILINSAYDGREGISRDKSRFGRDKSSPYGYCHINIDYVLAHSREKPTNSLKLA